MVYKHLQHGNMKQIAMASNYKASSNLLTKEEPEIYFAAGWTEHSESWAPLDVRLLRIYYRFLSASVKEMLQRRNHAELCMNLGQTLTWNDSGNTESNSTSQTTVTLTKPVL